VSLNPATQYADDTNLRARQRLWQSEKKPFDLVGWVLDTGSVGAGQRVLDVGCGNGGYLHEMARRDVKAVGCDLSLGMLRSAPEHALLVNADVCRLPLPDATFDVVLAPHMLYHVPDRQAAASEMRRVLRPGGVCVLVTNGENHMRSVRQLIEAAAREATPDWQLRSPGALAFSLENGGAQLRRAFDKVWCARPDAGAPVRIHDAGIVADYIASIADHYQHELDRPWAEVVEAARSEVQATIDRDGAFLVEGDVGAFVCR
jgi:SAM-dependent methyltransferase